MAKVIVKHINSNKEEVAPNTILTGEIGEEYVAKPIDKKDIVGYACYESDKKGIFTEEDIIVEFKYGQVFFMGAIKYILKENNKSIKDSGTFKFVEGTKFKINVEEIPGYTFIEANGELEGIAEEKVEERILYYEREKRKISIKHIDSDNVVFDTEEKEYIFDFGENTKEIFLVSKDISETPDNGFYDKDYIKNGNKNTEIKIPFSSIEDLGKVPEEVTFNYLKAEYVVDIISIDKETKKEIDVPIENFRFLYSLDENKNIGTIPKKKINGYIESEKIDIKYTIEDIMKQKGKNTELITREFEPIPTSIDFECLVEIDKKMEKLLSGHDNGKNGDIFQIGERDFLLNGNKVDKADYEFIYATIKNLENGESHKVDKEKDIVFLERTELEVKVYYKQTKQIKIKANTFTCKHCGTKTKGNSFIVHTSEYGGRYIYCPHDRAVVFEDSL